jgi:hypothetical protein
VIAILDKFKEELVQLQKLNLPPTVNQLIETQLEKTQLLRLENEPEQEKTPSNLL